MRRIAKYPGVVVLILWAAGVTTVLAISVRGPAAPATGNRAAMCQDALDRRRSIETAGMQRGAGATRIALHTQQAEGDIRFYC